MAKAQGKYLLPIHNNYDCERQKDRVFPRNSQRASSISRANYISKLYIGVHWLIQCSGWNTFLKQNDKDNPKRYPKSTLRYPNKHTSSTTHSTIMFCMLSAYTLYSTFYIHFVWWVSVCSHSARKHHNIQRAHRQHGNTRPRRACDAYSRRRTIDVMTVLWALALRHTTTTTERSSMQKTASQQRSIAARAHFCRRTANGWVRYIRSRFSVRIKCVYYVYMEMMLHPKQRLWALTVVRCVVR